MSGPVTLFLVLLLVVTFAFILALAMRRPSRPGGRSGVDDEEDWRRM